MVNARLIEAGENIIKQWNNRGETTNLYEWGLRMKEAIAQLEIALSEAASFVGEDGECTNVQPH